MISSACSFNNFILIRSKRTFAIALASLVALTCFVGVIYANHRMDRDQLQAFVKKRLSTSSRVVITQNLVQGKGGFFDQGAKRVVIDDPVLISSLASTLSIRTVDDISSVPVSLLPEATIEIASNRPVMWVECVAFSEDLRGGSPMKIVICLPNLLGSLGIGRPVCYFCRLTSESTLQFSKAISNCLDSK